MNKIFANIIAQFKEFYRNLTPIKRASVLGSVIVASGTLVIISLMVSGAHYKPLLKDIPADQLPLVIGQLEKNNIPFKMEAQGNTISVPENLLHASQMVIMAQLGPSNIGSIGLELFEKQDFGVTSYAQRINYQRALQGELTRAINTLSSVKRSKVILALAPKKTFLEESAKTTASVVLELYPGKHLQEDQVRGITYLVASSVEGLEPEEVTVVDSRGKVLSKKISGGASESADLMEVQRKMEMDLESRVEAILSKAVGAGKVIAKINVKLNPNHVDTVQELVDPDQTAVLSSVTEEEKLNGARSNPVGIPGARANLPGAGDQGQVGFKQDVNKELKTTNYQVSKTVKKIRQMSGNIEKISAAILIDGTLINETDDKGNVKQTWQQRTPEE
ncbi:MAG: flagellar M-ring protein FliF, partial [Bdellovibrionales bacterium]|nr:flagellar M-ring protein FliF [Bdellovibrionales bacterium]